MRIKIGRVVNTDKAVNLIDLSPVDRIIASATSAYKNTAMYKRRYAENEEKREERKRKVRETLTDSILATIQPELIENHTLETKGDKCDAVLIKIPAKFKGFLQEVLDTHDFDAYNVTIIPPAQGISKFCEPPYLVYLENKGGNG